MVTAIGTGDVFSRRRDFAAWLGLVPRQMPTGDRTILGKNLSKRGNRYLRVLFVQGTRVVLTRPQSWAACQSWAGRSQSERSGGLKAQKARVLSRVDRDEDVTFANMAEVTAPAKDNHDYSGHA
jgi:transposase